MKLKSSLYAALALVSAVGMLPHRALAQATSPVQFSWMPNQITASWIYTREDYEFSNEPGLPAQRLTLQGANAEYAYRRWYPWMIDASFRYQKADLLGQKLLTGAAGVGYVRQFGRYAPYGELQVGATNTSSTDYQYLYTSSQLGLTTLLQGGIDVRLGNGLFGVRPVYVENQYLPFGVQGHQSIYWNIGAGTFIRFEKQP